MVLSPDIFLSIFKNVLGFGQKRRNSGGRNSGSRLYLQFSFNKAGPWSNVDIYTGAAKDLIAEAHCILVNKAPECNVVVRKSAGTLP